LIFINMFLFSKAQPKNAHVTQQAIFKTF
jgi:hypothetical protein